jgi:hypothetical protein
MANGELMELLVDGEVMKCQVGEIVIWQNGELMKW